MCHNQTTLISNNLSIIFILLCVRCIWKKDLNCHMEATFNYIFILIIYHIFSVFSLDIGILIFWWSSHSTLHVQGEGLGQKHLARKECVRHKSFCAVQNWWLYKIKLNKVDKEQLFLANDIFDISWEEGFGKVLK